MLTPSRRGNLLTWLRVFSGRSGRHLAALLVGYVLDSGHWLHFPSDDSGEFYTCLSASCNCSLIEAARHRCSGGANIEVPWGLTNGPWRGSTLIQGVAASSIFSLRPCSQPAGLKSFERWPVLLSVRVCGILADGPCDRRARKEAQYSEVFSTACACTTIPQRPIS
jgi:hypothetical protein